MACKIELTAGKLDWLRPEKWESAGVTRLEKLLLCIVIRELPYTRKSCLFAHWKKNAVTVTARLEKSCAYIVVLRKYQQRAYLSLCQSRAQQGKKIESCLGRKMVGRGLSVYLWPECKNLRRNKGNCHGEKTG